MDHTFLWCAISLIIHEYRRQIDGYSNSLKVVVTSSTIEGNTYSYIVHIDDFVFHVLYKFDSNTFVLGVLEISEHLQNTSKTYTIVHDHDVIKAHSQLNEYTEFHKFDMNNVIAIYCRDGHKTEISNLTIISSEGSDAFEDANIGYLEIGIPTELSLNREIITTLFAVSGAIGNKVTACTDVATFATQSLTLVIYTDIGGEVVCINEKPSASNDYVGHISVMNTDFKQDYRYTFQPDSTQMSIDEIVMSRHRTPRKKRTYLCDGNDKVVVPNVGTFDVKVSDTKDVMFKLQK